MKTQNKTKQYIFMAMFGALSGLLMLFEFIVPLVPTFIKFDFSDMPIIIAGFMYGPMAALGAAGIKIGMNLLLNGTTTMFIGELSNFVLTLLYAVPAALIYKHHKSKHSAKIGLVVSTLIVSIGALLSNLFVMFPVYANLFGMSMDQIVQMATAVNPAVTNTVTMMIFAILPFNLFKYTVESILVLIIYKRISTLLKKA